MPNLDLVKILAVIAPISLIRSRQATGLLYRYNTIMMRSSVPTKTMKAAPYSDFTVDDKASDNSKLTKKVQKELRAAIAALLPDHNHDDGSWAPLFIRLAWHVSGTYSKDTNDGGSNGCTMRFDAEKNDPENAGLSKAVVRLASVKKKFPFVSLADLIVLSGCVSIQETGGPHIPMSYGRRDFSEDTAEKIYGSSKCPYGDAQAFKTNPHGSRLPAADLGVNEGAPKGCPMAVKEKPTIDAIREVFTRLGMSDKETVCLIILGHQFGRGHSEVSGYEGPWYERRVSEASAE